MEPGDQDSSTVTAVHSLRLRASALAGQQAGTSAKHGQMQFPASRKHLRSVARRASRCKGVLWKGPCDGGVAIGKRAAERSKKGALRRSGGRGANGLGRGKATRLPGWEQ
jgi:hypothetical protein